MNMRTEIIELYRIISGKRRKTCFRVVTCTGQDAGTFNRR